VVIVSKKAVVKRITSEEDALIEVLRTHGMPDVLHCLNNAISALPPESSDFLRSARTALKPNIFMSVQNLVDLNALTEEDANILIAAILSNRNIAVIGDSGSGKTTLLHALVCTIEAYNRVIVIEPVQEMDFSLSSPDKDILSLQSGSLISTDMLDLVLRTSHDRVVFGEILRSGDVSALAISALCGQSIMFSAKVSESEAVLDFLESTLGEVKPHLITALNGLNLLTIRCTLNEDGSRVYTVEN
jgi:type IV secretory pathway ATPase VirB11/archaellum biosynthesis ATPase